ncbi:MAG: hypothetical protein HRT68_02505 [Flavobacteriaceae bacterium]|nr:hypothetical protein [Flavobacteriaceae bacterium]
MKESNFNKVIKVAKVITFLITLFIIYTFISFLVQEDSKKVMTSKQTTILSLVILVLVYFNLDWVFGVFKKKKRR